MIKFSNVNLESWVNLQWMTGLYNISQNHCHVCSMINFDTLCQLFPQESTAADLSPVSFLLPASQQLCHIVRAKPCQNQWPTLKLSPNHDIQPKQREFNFTGLGYQVKLS